jgi:hypothetical protein
MKVVSRTRRPLQIKSFSQSRQATLASPVAHPAFVYDLPEMGSEQQTGRFLPGFGQRANLPREFGVQPERDFHFLVHAPTLAQSIRLRPTTGIPYAPNWCILMQLRQWQNDPASPFL